jgi:AsmA protein
MGKLLKIFLTVIASLLLLIIIAIFALPFFINPNDFKPHIQTAVKDKTGRELSIAGDLELSVFPWLGVSTGKLSLSNARGFADNPFAEIDESEIKVKLLPLFSKKIEVSRIVIKALVLNLAKNKQGITNWDDLSSEKSEEKPPTIQEKSRDSQPDSGNAFAALAIGGLSIENANIVWDDRQADKYTEIKEFNLNTDKLEFNESVGIDLSLILVNKNSQLTEAINFSTDLILNENLDAIQLKKLQLESHTSGKDIPGGNLKATLFTSDVAINLTQQTVDISGIKISSGDLILSADIKGTHIKDKPSFQGSVSIAEFNLAKRLKEMTVSVPAMQDGSALSSLAVNFNLQATDNSVALQNMAIKLDDTSIKGAVNIKNFAAPAIIFNLNVDSIDVDRYLAPEKEGKSPKPVVVASPASVAVAGASLFPVETLRKLNAKGDLTIDQLTVNNMKMQGLSLKLDGNNGLVKTQQTVKQFYQGAYAGSTVINVKGKQPSIALNEKLSNVQFEPYMKDILGDSVRMSGIVNATANLRGYGDTSAAIKSSLDGSLKFQFKDSIIRGFNLQKIIDNSKALLNGTSLPTDNKNDQTLFSEISGSAKIINGLVKNNDLKAISSTLRINGEGTADLATEELNYTVHAKLIKKATADKPESVKGAPLIFKIGGTFAKPSYALDITAILIGINKDKIEEHKENILKKLDKKFGPGVSDLLKGFFK